MQNLILTLLTIAVVALPYGRDSGTIGLCAYAATFGRGSAKSVIGDCKEWSVDGQTTSYKAACIIDLIALAAGALGVYLGVATLQQATKAVLSYRNRRMERKGVEEEATGLNQ
ncbi:hypothetical protein C1H76_0101 [Elsinoe australis]|uniref:Uncharacterized protein n=1 Tax=Elsinoe australis TaxID=40998 RepID=A0A4U7BC32_9PEZI|nr:hypothetical protein C1H76_0101 [Elsinoe australis]